MTSTLNVQTGVIVNGDLMHRIAPGPAKILQILARANGAPVAWEGLASAVWGDLDRFFDTWKCTLHVQTHRVRALQRGHTFEVASVRRVGLCLTGSLVIHDTEVTRTITHQDERLIRDLVALARQYRPALADKAEEAFG